MLQVWMQRRAFDPEKCGSGKKTERVLKGNAWATGIYLSIWMWSWRQENAAQVIKLFKDADTATQWDSMQNGADGITILRLNLVDLCRNTQRRRRAI